MKILIFGGSGSLGTELRKLNKDIIAPKHYECNVVELRSVHDCLTINKPDVVINCSAVIDNRTIEHFPIRTINVNIIGSANVALICAELGIRYVYISTDYIYKGDRGNYKETDEILPFNKYAWSKLGGECSAVQVKNHLIIRTSFGKSDFGYKQAFTDKWASKDYVDVIAPMILDASVSPLTGILNLGTDRKTLYDYASERNDVEGVRIEDTNHFTPYDTSLNLQRWQDYKGSKSIAKPHTKCRCCGSSDLHTYLDLGLMPMANNLESTSLSARNKERYPLQVMFCKDCGLSQLSVVIDPEKLFSYYTYRSGINKGYIEHCKQMSLELGNEFGLSQDSFHIDIAGNDGTLLSQFRNIIGLKVLNVDPASNLTAIAESQGIPSISDFWSIDIAKKYENTADLITATNVFAHLDDIESFIKACRISLKDEGILVIENPYLVDFIENTEFDTVYFEHVTYWSMRPMTKICRRLDMKVIDCQKFDIHGGTMRYVIARKESKRQISVDVMNCFANEINQEYDQLEKYLGWSQQVNKVSKSFADNLLNLKKQGYSIGAFAASAKGNTLLNYAGINTDIIDFIADETPEKIGKFSPGTGIPIVNKYEIQKRQPDYIVILSWNFKDEIMDKLRPIFKGKFIIPIPEFVVI
jgi:dTDP-4-dehydrorhamnose reductase/SAM-dependent methyltransferase